MFMYRVVEKKNFVCIYRYNISLDVLMLLFIDVAVSVMNLHIYY